MHIGRVAIVGGTHGNEFTGAYLIKKWEKHPELLKKTSFQTLALLANPPAFQAGRRYIDRDLNRCFTLTDLQNPTLSAWEDKRAKELNQLLGPKGQPKLAKFDFILDLHSTTANMGLTAILPGPHSFYLQLAASLSSIEPAIKILYYNLNQSEDSYYLESISERGFTLEVGPIPQGTLHAGLFQKTEALVYAILDYLEKYNLGQLTPANSPLTLYRHLKVVDYPRNKNGELEGMVHPQLQGRDYQELKKGDPLFLTFEGETIYYEESETVWPVFINEAAYYEQGAAMCYTKKTEVYL
ncbi:aspartoacylase [Kamptonema formosum]|uniref:aspartoacylase n=1 Tax=Kamptonema formosum TaxID=331992 RepID=UPI00034846D1|nr:aspartoacylase [Oscillatoria sp. PCC 10802]